MAAETITVKRSLKTRCTLAILAVIIFTIGLGLGLLIGHIVLTDELTVGDKVTAALKDEDKHIAELLMEEIQPDKLRDYLKYFTSQPHLAGTESDNEQALHVKQEWLDYGFDHAEAVPYKLYLSYPSKKESEESKVEILNPTTGDVTFTTQLNEEILGFQPNAPDLVPPYNAYSASGTVQGDVVYANYGREEDFEYLKINKSIDLTDKIALIRYGAMYRGNKVMNAMKFGIKAVILFTNKVSATQYGNDVYPETIYMPPSGVQRGSVLGDMGDPLTPGYPATDYAFRYEPEEAKSLPTIPVYPISYADAHQIFRRMDGDLCSNRCGINDDVQYRYGPGFRAPDDDKKIKVSVHVENKLATSYNVIGIIKGKVEPDRYVLLGNHRDAWTYGALDPSSGTACLMELARVFGKLLKTGWRPRRSIVFCSWGAEEFGIIGSNEWVEEFMKNLATRSVAYLNVDTAIVGNDHLRVNANPSLVHIIQETLKKIPDPYPDDIRKTVSDTRRERMGYMPFKYDPPIFPLPASSDHAPLSLQIGVPGVMMYYMYDMFKTPNVSWYPLYHTGYDTFYLAETHYDPEFKNMQTMTRVWGELTRKLADALILPINASSVGEAILSNYNSYLDYDVEPYALLKGVSFETLGDAIETFYNATQRLQRAVESSEKNDPMEIRLLNDQLMYMERGFIDNIGLPEKPFSTKRHIIHSQTAENAYRSSYFPTLRDAIRRLDITNDTTTALKEVEKEIARLTYHVYSAASTLDDVTTASLTRGTL